MTQTDDAVLDGLVQTSFTVMALLSQVAAAHDMSLTQLRVLAILRDREPKLTELAAYLGLERSSVSGLVDRAVRRGLVSRVASADDGRAVRLSLTVEGHREAERGTAEIATLLAPMTGALTPAEQNRLAGLLRKLLSR
jgi:DNA-binding MarR family transcriptional regulator